MPGLKLTKFLGMAPKMAEELLPETAAQQATNCKFYSGNLHPYPAPVATATLTRAGVIKSIYPLRDGSNNQVWLHWTTDVDVAQSQLAEDNTQRIYFTGDGAPKQTNYSLATTGVGDYPITTRPLGVPAPTAAATATTASTSAIASTNRARTNNIATVTLASAPLFGVGTSVTITGLGGTGYNLANVVVTAIVGNAISYNCPGANEGTAVDAAGSVAFAGLPLLRNYVYTWVTDWEEESAPSPATTDVSVYSGQRVNVATLPTAAPAGYASIVTKKNLYRTVTGAAGTFYFLVARDIALATATYTDTLSDAALADPLESLDYDMPDAGMQGIANMPNGMLVGFFDNQLCFSEPYRPWAWPTKYRRTVNAPIVGLGVLSNSAIVLTERSPTVAQGTSPVVVSLARIDMNYPCVSKRSIVNMGAGIIYAAPDGLIFITQMGNDLATKLIHYRDTWKEQVTPETIIGRYYSGKYFASGEARGFIFERDEQVGGIYSDVSFTYTAGYYDYADGYLYYVDTINGSTVKRWDDLAEGAGTMEWWSKRFRLPTYTNFGAARVFADYAAGADVAAENAVRTAANLALTETLGALGEHAVADYALGESELLDLLDGAASVVFQLYSNENLMYTTSRLSDGVFRLPAGYKSDNISIRIASNVRVREIHIAETPTGLSQV